MRNHHMRPEGIGVVILVWGQPERHDHTPPATNSALTFCWMRRRLWHILSRNKALNLCLESSPPPSYTLISSGGQPKERLKGS
jgi:hypothetical protein